MIEECRNAASWWARQLGKGLENRPGAVERMEVHKDVLRAFETRLAQLLLDKYKGHWHEDDIYRGSAYRCISYDHRLDPVLEHAAESAGLESIEALLEGAKGSIVFVNPGVVSVRNTVLISEESDIIWSKDGRVTMRPHSPPSPAPSTPELVPTNTVVRNGPRTPSPPKLKATAPSFVPARSRKNQQEGDRLSQDSDSPSSSRSPSPPRDPQAPATGIFSTPFSVGRLSSGWSRQ